ncbi:hypothetical protein [Nocardia salmonicida]|uniref:hypothetical protein n=2 Tax=Nocardia salmonicida TaxID=53431 RepID=UPI0033D1633B
MSERERAAQRRIGAVIRSCGVMSEDGLALWREDGCAEFKASAGELADDMAILGVPHTVDATTLPPLVSDRSRRVRDGEEVRVSPEDLPILVAWIPSLQKPIDQLAVLAAENP